MSLNCRAFSTTWRIGRRKFDRNNSWIYCSSRKYTNNICLCVVDRFNSEIKIHNNSTTQSCKKTKVGCCFTVSKTYVWNCETISIQKSPKHFLNCCKFDCSRIFRILSNVSHFNVVYNSIPSRNFCVSIIFFVRRDFCCCRLSCCFCKICSISDYDRIRFTSIGKINIIQSFNISYVSAVNNACNFSICNCIAIWNSNLVCCNKGNLSIVSHFPNSIISPNSRRETETIEGILLIDIINCNCTCCNLWLNCVIFSAVIIEITQRDFAFVKRVWHIINTRELHLSNIFFSNFASRITKGNSCISIISVNKTCRHWALSFWIFNCDVCIRIFHQSIVFINKACNHTTRSNVCEIIINLFFWRFFIRAFFLCSTKTFNITVLYALRVVDNKTSCNRITIVHDVVNLNVFHKWSTDISSVCVDKARKFALSSQIEYIKLFSLKICNFVNVNNMSEVFTTNTAVHNWSIVFKHKTRNLAFNVVLYRKSNLISVCTIGKFYNQPRITSILCNLIFFIKIWNYFTIIDYSFVYKRKASNFNLCIFFYIDVNLTTIINVYPNILQGCICCNRVKKCKSQRPISIYLETVQMNCISISIQTVEKSCVKWRIVWKHDIVHQDIVSSFWRICRKINKFFCCRDLSWRLFIGPYINNNQEIIMRFNLNTLIVYNCIQSHKLNSGTFSWKHNSGWTIMQSFFFNAEEVVLCESPSFAVINFGVTPTIRLWPRIPKLLFQSYWSFFTSFHISSVINEITNISVIEIVMTCELIPLCSEFCNRFHCISIISVIVIFLWKQWIVKLQFWRVI